MESLRSYILGVVCAAIICSLLQRLVHSGSASPIVKMLSGIVMTLCVMGPLISLELGSVNDLISSYAYDAQQAVNIGVEQSKEQLKNSITEATRTYILDKAKAMGADIAVTVVLTDDEVPVPWKVEVTGSISPYARNELQQIMEDDLGISKENQIWK